MISCGTTARSEAHGNSHIVPGFQIQTHPTPHSLTISHGYTYDGQHIPSPHRSTSESSVGYYYCHLFAPATEHSGWEREAGLWLPGLSVCLVPGQGQALEAPQRAPTGVAPACGLTQDETCLQTKTQFTSQVISSCWSNVFGSDREVCRLSWQLP